MESVSFLFFLNALGNLFLGLDIVKEFAAKHLLAGRIDALLLETRK